MRRGGGRRSAPCRPCQRREGRAASAAAHLRRQLVVYASRSLSARACIRGGRALGRRGLRCGLRVSTRASRLSSCLHARDGATRTARDEESLEVRWWWPGAGACQWRAVQLKSIIPEPSATARKPGRARPSCAPPRVTRREGVPGEGVWVWSRFTCLATDCLKL